MEIGLTYSKFFGIFKNLKKFIESKNLISPEWVVEGVISRMGDNDFPTVMANGGKSFVDGYIRRKNLYSQSGSDIPALSS